VKALRYLNKYFLKYRYRLLAGILVVILSNLFYVLPAPIVRHALDLVVNTFSQYPSVKGTTQETGFMDQFYFSIWKFVGLIIIVSILRGLFLYLQRHILIGMSRLIEYDLKNEIYAHYQLLPLEFYRRNNTGDLMARISEDVSQVRMYLGPAIMYGLNLVSLFLIVIPFMVVANGKLTLYTLIPLPFLSISIYYVNSIINERSTRIQQGLSRLSTFVQEAFSGIRVIKAFAREKDSAERLAEESHHYREKSLRLVTVDAFFFPLILLLTGLSTILVIYVGGEEVIAGSMDYGVIAEFVIYINMLTWPVASLGWTTSLVQRAEASQARINEFLNTPVTIVSEKDIDKELDGDIVFDKVTFAYPDSGILAVNDLSFTIKPGESLAILGSTGSGKSTVANLLCRLYDPQSGIITFDGIPAKHLSLKTIRRQIGYVPQDVFLFSDTIRNNIAFGSDNLHESRIKQASVDADLYNNIMDFPAQFETILGERGITLSGGQKQRLSIARAIVKDPRILILDDSLSAVDTKTEHNILNSLRRIMKGKSTLIISHRVSSAKLADKIIVLDKGQIVQAGTHDLLVNQEGVYRNLYYRQMEEAF
jgi:ATP-binding cassette, subfamily B, multidrug efflux pump